MSRRAKILVVIGYLAFACLVVRAFYQKEIRVAYHRNRMWAARKTADWFSYRQQETPLESLQIFLFRMSGHKASNTMLYHEGELIELGYFEKRDFVFTNRIYTNDGDWPVLLSQITNTFDSTHWWTCRLPVSNGLNVVATPADMPKWEKLISDFDKK